MGNSNADKDRAFLTKYAWLSIAAALVTISLKTFAYSLTDSVGFFSDAVESLVNLTVAILALAVLIIAARPADEEHAYGHSKAEYFSSGAEGSLILIAALSIAYTGYQRLLSPQPLEQIGQGLAISVVASVINLIVALVLLRASKQHESVTLEANAQHLLSDVWTSVGVVLGVAAVAYTGWQILDPLIAFAVAINITITGAKIVVNSAQGLMDTSLPEEDVERVKEILGPYTKDEVRYHALRTRRSGARRFVSLHILVPGKWSVKRGHQLLEKIEADIRASLPTVTVFTHLESLEDPRSWEDQTLDR
jgi:cation diffusion facilitator family transporter